MRRISIAFALSTVLLVSICPAQQTSSSESNRTDSGRNASLMASEPALTGGGTTNYIARWISPANLGNSAIYQANTPDAAGVKIGIGTTSPRAMLDVHGNINTARTYEIGGSTVLSIGGIDDTSLFLGIGAGSNNMMGQGINNFFSGYQAGRYNSTGNGNTFSGTYTGYYNSIGYGNTFYGAFAGLSNTTGSYNTFSGYNAGLYNTGDQNTFSGDDAGIFTNQSII